MLTILGAVFSSWRIYMLLGLAVAAAALFGYIMYLRADAASAYAALSAAEATINEEKSVIEMDAATITNLQAERAADEAALRSVATSTAQLNASLSSIKDQINAIPEPKTCQLLDPRDRAAVDGVRRLVTPSPADPNHGH